MWVCTVLCTAEELYSTYLGFHMVGDVVNSASQWDFPNRPRGVVRQVGGQNTDPQLTLWSNTFKH